MKKYVMLVMVLLLISIPSVAAETGSLRIDPTWPLMVESPATFTVWTQTADTYEVNVLLVVTEECYNGMPNAPTTAVEVTYDDGLGSGFTEEFDKNDFNPETGMGGVYVPGTGLATTGACYEVSSLKDHLDYDLSEPLDKDDTIYWARRALPHNDFDPLTRDPVEITVTLDSSAPRMLVYLLGKSEDGAELFDVRVPPTNPGFVVPEISMGTIMVLASMFTALGLYIYKKKQT